MANTLTIYNFTKLMLLILAQRGSSCKNKKIFIIPFNYRERIENILCTDNGWRKRFSCLIDINEYFDDHFYWEEDLAKTIKNVVEEYGSEITFDIVNENMSIAFEKEKIQDGLKQYDNFIIDRMKHFASVMMSHIYSRHYKEEFVDYSSRSSAKMRELNEKRIQNQIGDMLL